MDQWYNEQNDHAQWHTEQSITEFVIKLIYVDMYRLN